MKAHEKMSARLEEMRLSVSAAARELDAYGLKLSHTTLGRYLNGQDVPRFHHMLILAKFFGLPIEYLADDGLDDPSMAGHGLTADERRVIELARKVGVTGARAILENAETLGPEEAKRRLLQFSPPPLLGQQDPASDVAVGGDKRANSHGVHPGSVIKPHPRRK